MISIRFVNELLRVKENSSLAELLVQKGYENKACAIAVNNHFIPMEKYQITLLKENDCVDVIVPMQGG